MCDSRGDIRQFRYGEDGVDTAKSDHGKAVNTERLVERVELTIEKGAKASKPYVEKKVSDVRKEPRVLLVNSRQVCWKES